ncbi:DUF3368 domain-containing protein [Roseofilum reptotaenium CS-1145]|uniref:DUF3368 domain-containing protein n=1 Tax=Roseofilum reptotaenium TaxID=1233427 RepID=UPI000B1A750C|nr:DUF3368 domain-containing protein [Roseofilum reptotaenium]MDB9516372.1 DUF3368 domain-containing protein [Roseofilum reptotaenium CS-1145]
MGDHPAAQQVQDLSWLQVVTVNNQRLVEELQESFHLDLGESEAIALAEETKADQLLIDERAARRVALERKLPLIGTMGVLVLAKRQSLIPNVKDVLKQRQDRGTRISNHLYEQVLTLAQEI